MESSRWVSLKDARVLGCEWWRCEGGRTDNNYQVTENHNRPVLRYPNGDMYLGGWAKCRSGVDKPQGFGVFLSFDLIILVGQWDEGHLQGYARQLWLPQSGIWRNNYDPLSCIKTDNGVGLPFLYFGNFQSSKKNDPKATVVLKDGTTRIGPWKDDLPVGDWWQDHESSRTPVWEIKRLLTFTSSDFTRKNLASYSDDLDTLAAQDGETPIRCFRAGAIRNNTPPISSVVVPVSTPTNSSRHEQSARERLPQDNHQMRPSLKAETSYLRKSPTVRFTSLSSEQRAKVLLRESPAVRQATALLRENPTVPQSTELLRESPAVRQATALLRENPAVPQSTTLLRESPAVRQAPALLRESPAVPQPIALLRESPAVRQATALLRESPAVPQSTVLLRQPPDVLQSTTLLRESPAVRQATALLRESFTSPFTSPHHVRKSPVSHLASPAAHANEDRHDVSPSQPEHTSLDGTLKSKQRKGKIGPKRLEVLLRHKLEATFSDAASNLSIHGEDDRQWVEKEQFQPPSHVVMTFESKDTYLRQESYIETTPTLSDVAVDGLGTDYMRDRIAILSSEERDLEFAEIDVRDDLFTISNLDGDSVKEESARCCMCSAPDPYFGCHARDDESENVVSLSSPLNNSPSHIVTGYGGEVFDFTTVPSNPVATNNNGQFENEELVELETMSSLKSSNNCSGGGRMEVHARKSSFWFGWLGT